MSAFGDSYHTGLGNNGFEVSLNYITGIPDPNHLTCSNTLKLTFKSLLKRDVSTKEKSITAMFNYLTENPEELNDDLTIITWVQLYPKLSVDDSRKIRVTAHQIQSLFVLKLGKKYAKYLRDTIAIWLAGIYDSDRTVSKICNESIHSTFNGDKVKISNLWKIFFPQIIKYSHQVICCETKDTISDERFSTKDETEAKFIRLLQGSILVLVHALNENNATTPNDELVQMINDIYSNDSLHDCFTSTNFNLKKAAYTSYKTLLKSSGVMNKQLYKALSKSMVKGLKFDSKTNPLLYSSIIITILETLCCVTEYDTSFWINIKKSDEKLLSLLKLGSLNSEPQYYDIIYKLINLLPDEVVSFKDTPKMEPYSLALMDGIKNEKSITFIEKGWIINNKIIKQILQNGDITDKILEKYTLNLITLMDSPRVLSKAIISLLKDVHEFSNDDKDVLLDINSAIMDALPDKKIVFTEFKNFEPKYQTKFIESFVQVLIANGSDLAEVLLANSVDSLSEYDRFSSNPELSFNIINLFIKQGDEQYHESINDFTNSLPEYLSETFIDVPLETLILYSHSSLSTDPEVVNNLVNKFYIKLQELKHVENLLRIISKLQKFDIHKSRDLNSYLVENSRSLSPSSETQNSSSLYEFSTPEILSNLFKSDTYASFVSNCSKYYNNTTFVEFTKQNIEFINRLCLSLLYHQQNDAEYDSSLILLKNLQQIFDTDAELIEMFVESLLFTVCKYEGSFVPLISHLSPILIKSLLKKDLFEEYKSIFTSTPQSLLSMGNSLGLSVYLFIDDFISTEPLNIVEAKRAIYQSVFLTEVVAKFENDTTDENDILTLALVAELSSDILFLQNSFTGVFENKIIDFQSSIKSKFLKIFEQYTFVDIVNILKSSEALDLQNFLNLINNENKLFSYYAHRLLKILLDDKVVSISMKDFESIDFKPFRSKLTLLNVILESSTEFLPAKNLDFTRTDVVANLIGLRDSDSIIKKGLPYLVTLNNFINLDTDNEGLEKLTLIAPARCMMLLNAISDWLDCDVAFEDVFNPVRIALMQFVQRYITSIYYVCDSNYLPEYIEKVFKLGVSLFTGSFTLINSEDKIALDLTYFSLKQYILLLKYKGDIDIWDSEVADVNGEIIEIFFKIADIKGKNQPLKICCEQISKLFSNHFDMKSFNPFYEKLYNLIDSDNTDFQRLTVSLLHKMIPEVQDNLVVEFALSKKKVNEDGVSNIELPKVLLDHVNKPLNDYIEYEEESDVYKYLWCWYLVMDHFKNISQQMRQDYISNLNEETICKFLDFLFSELDVSKFKLHDDDENYVKNYSVEDNKVLTYEEEVKKLLVNLVYELMDNIGGTLTQNWFRSIKDKQLQQNTEKFIINFISPQLINDILSTLSGKTSIEDSEFKININKKMNEIKCLYNIDEQKMEISIVLPSNYPLSQISVNGVSRVGVDEKKWKSWIMSAQYVINFQNGSILDSIKHFKDNVTANFENYEDCAICYSILNAVDHSTPNKVCPTCKHNFHSACLYRWFKSSGASTCPLCRSKFQFKKHS